MSYIKGTIVWLFKSHDDPDITFPGNDPVAATVDVVHDDTHADLVVMLTNTQAVTRVNVPLADPENRPARPYALVDRIEEASE